MDNKELNKRVAHKLLGWLDVWGEPAYYLNDELLAKQIAHRLGDAKVERKDDHYEVVLYNRNGRKGEGRSSRESIAVFLAALDSL